MYRYTKHRTAKRKKTQCLVAEASAEASNLVSDDVDSGTTSHRVTRTTAIENHGQEEAFDILHTRYQDDCFVLLDHNCINQDPGTVTTDEISGEGQEFELNYDDHMHFIRELFWNNRSLVSIKFIKRSSAHAINYSAY